MDTPEPANSAQREADGGLVEEPVTSDSFSSRNRAGSPWHFQLNKQAINRLRPPDGTGSGVASGSGSGVGSGNVTPVTTRYGASTRSLSGPRTASVVQAAQRASYESALLAAVRRQIESFEEKVGSQISRIQTQSERAREATITRLEEKMSAADCLQPKLDRRLAELSGNFKGLSDEMQAQIRRVDLMDDRLWEWRHQMEEDLRHKYADFEQNVQKVTSGFKVLTSNVEDFQRKQQQKLQRLETDQMDRGSQEDISQAFANICARLDALEVARVEEDENQLLLPLPVSSQDSGASALVTGSDPLVTSSLYDVLAKRVEDLSAKIEQALQDNHDLHASTAAQEEQLKTLRTLFEAREEHVRGLFERVERGDWDSKLEQIRQGLQEDGKLRLSQAEQLEILSKRLEHQEQAQEAIVTSHNQLVRYGGVAQEQDDEMSTGLAEVVEACQSKLSASEEQLRKLSDEVQELRTDSLGKQVSSLVQQLKDVVPMVIDHDRSIKQLDAGDGQLLQLKDEVGRLKLDISQGPAVDEGLKAQVEATASELRELQGRWSRCEEVVAEHRQLAEAAADKLSLELQELGEKSQCEPSADLTARFSGSVEELRQKLEALSQAVVEASRAPSVESLQDELRSSLQRAQEDWRQRFAGSTADLQQKLEAVSQAVLQAAEAAPSSESIDSLRSDMQRLKGQSDDLRRQLSGSMEDVHLKLQSFSEALTSGAPDDEGLKSELKELKTAFRGLSEECQQKYSGSMELQEKLQNLSHMALQAAEAEPNAGESMQLLRKEMKDELRKQQSRSEESYKDLSSEIQRLAREDSTVAEKPKDDAWKVPFRALQDELDTMKAAAAAAEISDAALVDLRRAVESFKDQLGAKSSTDQDGIQAVRSEVAELSSRLNALVGTISKGSFDDIELRQEVTELAMIMKQDEEAEATAHRRILSRIDELCGHLGQATVETVESRAHPDFEQKFDALVKQVEDMQKVEQEIEVKIEQVASKLA